MTPESPESLEGVAASSLAQIRAAPGSGLGPMVTFYSADENGKWEGYWVDHSGPHPCETKEDESYYWGVVEFQFNEAYNEFEEIGRASCRERV
jgi:hypothetical protein